MSGAATGEARGELVRVELHLRLRVQRGRREEFLAFLREATPYYEAPGGIEIRLLEDLADDHRRRRTSSVFSTSCLRASVPSCLLGRAGADARDHLEGLAHGAQALLDALKRL